MGGRAAGFAKARPGGHRKIARSQMCPQAAAGFPQAGSQRFTPTAALVHFPEQPAAPSEVFPPPAKSATISLAQRLPQGSWL